MLGVGIEVLRRVNANDIIVGNIIMHTPRFPLVLLVIKGMAVQGLLPLLLRVLWEPADVASVKSSVQRMHINLMYHVQGQ